MPSSTNLPAIQGVNIDINVIEGRNLVAKDSSGQGFLNLYVCQHRLTFKSLISAREIVQLFQKFCYNGFWKSRYKNFDVSVQCTSAVAIFIATFVAKFVKSPYFKNISGLKSESHFYALSNLDQDGRQI